MSLFSDSAVAHHFKKQLQMFFVTILSSHRSFTDKSLWLIFNWQTNMKLSNLPALKKACYLIC